MIIWTLIKRETYDPMLIAVRLELIQGKSTHEFSYIQQRTVFNDSTIKMVFDGHLPFEWFNENNHLYCVFIENMVSHGKLLNHQRVNVIATSPVFTLNGLGAYILLMALFRHILTPEFMQLKWAFLWGKGSWPVGVLKFRRRRHVR